MNTAIATPVVYSILRQLLAAIGGAVLVTKHDSELMTLAGFLVAVVPVVWGALTAKSNHEQKEVLKEDKEILAEKVEEAKSETEVLKRIIAPDGGNLKLP